MRGGAWEVGHGRLDMQDWTWKPVHGSLYMEERGRETCRAQTGVRAVACVWTGRVIDVKN